MCGRIKLDKSVEELIKHFNVVFEKPEDIEFEPNSNVSPGQILPVITSDEPERLQLFKWGLLPSWSKDMASGYKMFNARAESLTERASYRNLIKRNRCLVLTTGFYEWKASEGKKIPFIFRKEEKYTALAGLWDYNPHFNINTFTVITCAANNIMADYHDRMPVILNEDGVKKWLSDITEDEALALLKPYDETMLVDKTEIEKPASGKKKQDENYSLF